MFPLSTFTDSRSDPPFSAERALYAPLGAASPLWAMFAGMAGAGLAFWWMTRWRSVTNLEALLSVPGAAAQPDLAAEPVGGESAPLAGAAAVAAAEEAAEAVEAAPSPEPEPEPAVAEAAPEPVPEPAAVEAKAEVEAKPAPKPKASKPQA